MIIARRNPGLPDPVWVMHWSAEITVSGPNLLRSLEISPTAFVSPLFIVRKVFAPRQIVTSAAERTRAISSASGFLPGQTCVIDHLCRYACYVSIDRREGFCLPGPVDVDDFTWH